MSKHTLVIVAGDRTLDRFMHAADMFAPFKRLIMSPMFIDVTLKPRHRISTTVQKVRKKFAEDKKMFLVAILVKGKKSRWVDPEIKVVSNGYQWGLLRDLVKYLEAAP